MLHERHIVAPVCAVVLLFEMTLLQARSLAMILFTDYGQGSSTSQPCVSEVCMKLSCPHSRGALGSATVPIASGCMRRTFLDNTISCSECSQLSQARDVLLNAARTRAAGDQYIVTTQLSLTYE
jgi:hypothetical protein